jgi:hypothetical protein
MQLITTALAGWRALFNYLAGLGRTFMLGGPVGVWYTLKLAYLKWRLARVSIYIHREKELHREHERALSHELNELIGQQQSTNIAAAQFWNWCRGKAGERS